LKKRAEAEEEEGGRGSWPKQCIQVSKCKNDKIKRKLNKILMFHELI
jgi:hypothetical protein